MGHIQTPDHKQVRSVPHTQSHTPSPRRSHHTLCGTSRPLVIVHSHPRFGYTPAFLSPHLAFRQTRTAHLPCASRSKGRVANGTEKSTRRAATPGLTCQHAPAPVSACCTHRARNQPWYRHDAKARLEHSGRCGPVDQMSAPQAPRPSISASRGPHGCPGRAVRGALCQSISLLWLREVK